MSIVTRSDLEGALVDGSSQAELARDMGVSSSVVSRACRENGISLLSGLDSRAGYIALEKAVLDMRPVEAVEALLYVVRDLTGSDGAVGYWPDGVHFTASERAVLRILFRREGRVVSYGAISAAIYGVRDVARSQNAISVFMCAIRRKSVGLGFSVKTYWGEGMRLVRDDGVVFPWEAQAGGF